MEVLKWEKIYTCRGASTEKWTVKKFTYLQLNHMDVCGVDYEWLEETAKI